MPLYDFECETCGHVWEDIETAYGTPLCLKCFSAAVHRKFPRPHVIGNKSDFDKLDKRPPDPPIVSGPHYRSK